MIPDFPGFVSLAMEHKEEVEAQFRAYQPVTSELTFTNLWMWQNHYHFEVARLGRFLCFLARPAEGARRPDGLPIGALPLWRPLRGLSPRRRGGGSPPHPLGTEGAAWCLPPVGEGDVRETARKLLEHLREMGSHRGLERVPERLVREEGLGQSPFVAQLDRDQSDYVYLSRDLIELSGREFHAKKNHVNRFKRTYRHEYHRLSADLVEACLALETAWCDLRHCWETPTLASEEVAIHEALHHFGELSYLGGVILLEGKVEAFALGEALNPDTFVCHVEKANPDVDGLYAAVNQMFCEAEAARFTYVNREQDLGVPGLRKAKESYQPHHLEHKYRVTLA